MTPDELSVIERHHKFVDLPDCWVDLVGKCAAEVRSLMAENERLGAALKQINSMYAEADPLKYWAEVSEIARSALSGGGEGGG